MTICLPVTPRHHHLYLTPTHLPSPALILCSHSMGYLYLANPYTMPVTVLVLTFDVRGCMAFSCW